MYVLTFAIVHLNLIRRFAYQVYSSAYDGAWDDMTAHGMIHELPVILLRGTIVTRPQDANQHTRHTTHDIKRLVGYRTIIDPDTPYDINTDEHKKKTDAYDSIRDPRIFLVQYQTAPRPIQQTTAHHTAEDTATHAFATTMPRLFPTTPQPESRLIPMPTLSRIAVSAALFGAKHI